MNNPKLDFYYDFGSPNAHLAHERLKQIAQDRGATIAYRPVLLGGIFKATNNQSPMTAFAHVTGKLAYAHTEITRFCERHGIAFTMNPAFPINTLPLMRAATFANGKPWEPAFVNALFRAMWCQQTDLRDTDTIASTLDNADLPGADILAATALPDIKGKLIANTESAVARGIFGAPTIFLDTEMFFGKDALSDLAWRLDA